MWHGFTTAWQVWRTACLKAGGGSFGQLERCSSELSELGARLAKLGTMLAQLGAYVALFRPMLACGVGGLGLVGRGLCVRVWGWWVGVGQWWCVLLGLRLVGCGWSGVVCACRYGIGGLG